MPQDLVMNEFSNIEAKARALMSDSPEQSLLLYKQLYREDAEEFKIWDAINVLKLLRQLKVDEYEWATDLVVKFKEEKLLNLFAWYCFDLLVKAKSQNEIIQQHTRIISAANLIPQKDLSLNSTYPCATTLSLFALAEAYAKGNFQASRVLEVLANLQPQYLSRKENSFKNAQNKETKIASPFEKYYSLSSKAFEQQGNHTKLIALLEEVLSQLDKFHHDNKVWFTKRLANAYVNIGKKAEAENLFREVLQSAAGSSKWFIYQGYAQFHFSNKEYDAAWRYSLEAAYQGGEPHFLIKLFLLPARILFKLERAKDAALYARLIAAILKEIKLGRLKISTRKL